MESTRNAETSETLCRVVHAASSIVTKALYRQLSHPELTVSSPPRKEIKIYQEIGKIFRSDLDQVKSHLSTLRRAELPVAMEYLEHAIIEFQRESPDLGEVREILKKAHDQAMEGVEVLRGKDEGEYRVRCANISCMHYLFEYIYFKKDANVQYGHCVRCIDNALGDELKHMIQREASGKKPKLMDSIFHKDLAKFVYLSTREMVDVIVSVLRPSPTTTIPLLWEFCKEIKRDDVIYGVSTNDLFGDPVEHRGNLVVFGILNGDVIVKDTMKGSIKTLEGFRGTLKRLALEGNAVVGAYDNEIREWDLKTGILKKTYPVVGHPVSHLVVDGSSILVGNTEDPLVLMWDRETTNMLPLSGLQLGTKSLHLSGDSVIVICVDGSIWTWDKHLKNAKLFQIEDIYPATAECFVVDGDDIIIGCSDGKISIYTKKSDSHAARKFGKQHSAVSCLKVHNNHVMSGSIDGVLRVWDKANGNLLYNHHTFSVTCRHLEVNLIEVDEHNSDVIIVGCKEEICALDITTGKNFGKSKVTSRICFLMKGDEGTVIFGCVDGKIRIWDMKTFISRTLDGHTHSVKFIERRGNSLVSFDGLTTRTWGVGLKTIEYKDIPLSLPEPVHTMDEVPHAARPHLTRENHFRSMGH